MGGGGGKVNSQAVGVPLTVVPGERDEVIWCQIKVSKLFRGVFGFIWLTL